jgi:tetratricopeptide (TPR) repeat protein
MPGAGHLVHMPGHIYLRVGRYLDSLRANQEAVKVDEALFAKIDDRSIYRGAYYPHNVHFVLVSAQMAGDGKTTLEAADKLATVISDQVAATVAWTQSIKAAPYFAHAQYSTAEQVLALPDPGPNFPFVRGAWHYARGVAFADKGDLDGARGEVEAIESIANTADLSFLIDNFVPADDLLHIARHVVQARIASQRGYHSTAIDELRQAVALQDGVPYQEPPYWYYPVRQSLGAAYLRAGRAQDAVTTFEAALKEAPNNGWAIYGLLQAQTKLGNQEGIKAGEAALSKTWVGPANLLDLSKL